MVATLVLLAEAHDSFPFDLILDFVDPVEPHFLADFVFVLLSGTLVNSTHDFADLLVDLVDFGFHSPDFLFHLHALESSLLP